MGILPPKGSTEEVVSEEEQIVNNLTGKADCVYQRLLSSSTGFANAIKKFDGEFPVAHLKFSERDLDNNVRGSTSPPSDFWIEIFINNDNSESGVNFRPNLLTAKTIIHEVIHAEMFRKLMELAGSNGSINVSILKTMLEKGDYPGMLDYYTRFGINGFQHQQMAQHYRETIARILQEFDTGISIPSGQQPLQFYMDLAWEGLNHSSLIAWSKAITLEERTRIDQVIASYIQNHKNENYQ